MVTAAREVAATTVGRIRFFADGASTGGRISLSVGDTRRIVTIDWLTGRARVDAR
jgi:general secretion pathway protein H